MAMHEGVIASHSIQLRNDASECSRLYAFLSDSIDGLPVTPDQHHDLKLAAEEILSNIIRHGYESATEAGINLEFIATENSISLVFSDSGHPFNPLDSSNMNIGDDLSEGGRMPSPFPPGYRCSASADRSSAAIRCWLDLILSQNDF